MENFQWQGEPIKATFGYCKIDNVKSSQKWYGYELSLGITTIPAIKIESNISNGLEDDEQFCFIIANFAGIGIKKITDGGWPNCAHYSFNKNNSTFYADDSGMCDFNQQQYEEITRSREEWYKTVLSPDEYLRRQMLIEIVHKNKQIYGY